METSYQNKKKQKKKNRITTTIQAQFKMYRLIK